MRRFNIVVMSLMAVAGVMWIAAADDTTMRVLGIIVTVAGLTGVLSAIMSGRNGKRHSQRTDAER